MDDSRVNIAVHWMGEDPVFLVTGGVAHLGAAAVAYVEGQDNIWSGVLTLPGHRETELAEELARMATDKLGRPAAVLVGIHLHKPTKQEIVDIVEEARQEMGNVLDRREDLYDKSYKH